MGEAGEMFVRRIALEILKPRKPDLIELTNKLYTLPGVEGVRVNLKETDTSTETISINLAGKLDYNSIKTLIEENSGVVHSLNTVVMGKLLGE